MRPKRNKKEKMIALLSLLLALSFIISPIIAVLTLRPVKAHASMRETGVNPINTFSWQYKTQSQLTDAVEILSHNITELNSVLSKIDKKDAKIEKAEDTLINDLIKAEVLKAQIKAISNSIIQQSTDGKIKNTEGEEFSLPDESKEIVQDAVALVQNANSKNNIAENMAKVVEVFAECPVGSTNCGTRTKDVSTPYMVGNESLSFPPLIEGKVSPEDAQTHKDSAQKLLKNLSTIVEASFDITIPTNGSSSSVEKWIKANGETYIERMQYAVLLSEVMKAYGLENPLASDLEKNTKTHFEKLKSLANDAGVSLKGKLGDVLPSENNSWTEPEDRNPDKQGLSDMDVSEIAELIDLDSNDISNVYKGLISWTSSFTPFETNLNEGYISQHLTDTETQAYQKYGDNRSMIFSTIGTGGGIARGLKEGLPYQYKPLSLGEFLDKYETDELVLFLDSQGNNSSETVAGNSGQAEVDGIKNGSKAGDILRELNQKVKNFGDSATDVTEQSDNNADTMMNNITGENQTQEVGQNKDWQSDVNKEKSKETIDVPRFIGPVYASSGEMAKEIYGLDDAGDAGNNSLLTKTDDTIQKMKDLVIPRGSSLDRLKGNTMNMNYMLMFNTLKNKQQLSMALSQDMDKPLYMDFIGNILTQSGYVVIPAAANYTLYNYADRLPMYNAMFINSYPEVVMDENDGFTLMSSIEKQKLLYQKTKGGAVRIGKLNKKGETVDKSFYALPFNSTALFTFEDTKVDFMDNLTMFRPVAKPFSFSQNETEQKTEDLVFINTGIVMRTFDNGVERVINVKKISGDGRTVDWQLLKNAHYNLYTQGIDMYLNAPLMTNIATVVGRANDATQTMTLDYLSGDDQLRMNNSLTQKLGELFDGFTENFLGKMGVNQLLYTPKINETMILGDDVALYGAQVIILLVLVAIGIFAFRIAIDAFSSDFTDAISWVISIIALVTFSYCAIFGSNYFLGFIFDKPTQYILREDIPMYMIEKIEQEHKNTPNTFFDVTTKDIESQRASITLEKLKNNDIKTIRAETGTNHKEDNPFYVGKFDQTRVNVIGDKVYLRGDELRMDVEDLMTISKVEDMVDESNSITLTPTYTGYGEVAYYMPYFNILDSLTNTINLYSQESNPPYRTIKYRQGFTKTTGRAEDYFKSVGFISPQMIEQHMQMILEEYQYNTVSEPAYNSKSSNFNIFKKTKKEEKEEAKENNTDWTGEEKRVELDETTGIDSEVSQDALTDVSEIQKDQASGYYFERYILPEIITERLEQELDVLNQMILFLNDNPEYNLDDWLGLRKVLLIDPATHLFPEDKYETIQNTKWYPEELKTDFSDDMAKKIKEVNDNTRRFVVNKIMPISGRISDDTLLKVVALYATTEFNRVFDTGPKTYPRQINSSGLSNSYTTKSIMIPQDEIFMGNANQTSLYLARETGWSGLGLALLDRIMYWFRMIIRMAVIRVLVVATPFMLVFKYLSKNPNSRNNSYFAGSLVTMFAICGLYILDIIWFKVAFIITNTSGTMMMLLIGIVPQVLLTILYFKLVKTLFRDPMNMGYGAYNVAYQDFSTSMSGYDLSTVKSSLVTGQMAAYNAIDGYINNSELNSDVDDNYFSSGSGDFDIDDPATNFRDNNPYGL